MDFVTRLPRTLGGYNAIWVIVDQLTKFAHFLPKKVSFSMDQLASLYVKEIVRMHGVLISIVSEKAPVSLPGFGIAYRKPWVLVEFQYCFSSSDRWLVRKGD